jgi:hypothetical protein
VADAGNCPLNIRSRIVTIETRAVPLKMDTKELPIEGSADGQPLRRHDEVHQQCLPPTLRNQLDAGRHN